MILEICHHLSSLLCRGWTGEHPSPDNLVQLQTKCLGKLSLLVVEGVEAVDAEFQECSTSRGLSAREL
jgi:hypothetical protein